MNGSILKFGDKFVAASQQTANFVIEPIAYGLGHIFLTLLFS